MISRVVLSLLLCSAFSLQAAVLFPTGSTWRFLRGTNEASFPDTLAWTSSTNTFNDSRFVDAPAPFWYGDVREGGTQLLDMQNNYTCIFLRKGFMVTNAAQYTVLRLNYFVDDGLVVWINGRELWRDNVATGPLSTNTLAANQPTDPAVYTNITINTGSGVLLDGSNTIAVQVFNTSAGSSDLGFDLSLEAFVPELIPPTVINVSPESGSVLTSLNSITVTFSEPVVGVTADDLLIDTQPANSVTAVGGTNYTFTFSTPPYGGVFISWFSDPGIFDLALPPNAFNAAASSWAYQLNDATPPVVDTLFPSAGSTVRALTQVEVTFSEEVNGVDAADLRVNGLAATSVSRAPGGPYVFQLPALSPGTVNLQWVGNHGIADQAEPPNAFAGGSWSYLLDPNVTVGNLIITEISASNQDGLADEDGEAQDWIEIQNRGVTALDLGGWSLSDDPELPGLWIFPTKVLGAGQFLVVFASGKDRKSPTGTNRFHTNFRLGAQGYLGLYNGDSPRVLVSGFTPYSEQRNDYSYGYDAQGALRYFATPTPGASNGTSTIHGVTEPVHFSTTRGFFTQPFTLNLTCPTPGAEIRYTTNGADPTLLNSYPYIGPMPIAGTTVLRAAAFRSNLISSVTKSHSYFFNQNAAIRSLPVISITTSISNLYGRSGILGMGGGSRASDGLFITNNPATDFHNPSMHGIAWERPVSVEYIKPEDNSGFQIDCGIRVQGSDWQRPRTMPNSKFSYRLYFRGDYGPSRLEYPIFPHTTVQSFDQLVLRAGYNEPNNPFIRDEMGRRTFGDMGNVTSQGGLAQIFTNGFYAGLYNPCERVHEEFGQSHHGGSSDWDVVGPDFALSSEGPGVVDGDRNDFRNMHNYINGQSASSILTSAVYNEIGRRLDLPNFVDYCLLNVYSAMGDWPANNWRAGKDRGPGGIWRFYVWDAEWGLGFSGRGFTRDSFAETGPGPNDGGLASTANSEIARIYQSLRRNPEFRLLWADRIYKHFFNGGALTEVAMTNRLNELRDQLAVVFALNVAEIGPFIANRRANILDDFQLYGLFGYSNALYGVFASSNAPAFNQFGGPVPPGFSLTMSAPLGGTIYYTTDGSDPRVPFTGAISNAATAYTAPLTLVQSGLIKARTLLNNTNWSALAEASFAVGTLGVPIRITEIMYNPTGGSIYEFIELQNIGAAPVDLGGMLFSEGIDFTFTAGTILAPGARLILANGTDPNSFAIRYPGVTPRGYFNGNLNNAGERITLRDGNNRIIASVNFRDNNGWPTAADGAGYSLELIDPLGNPDDGANWRASSALNGSPGTAGAAPPPATVRLNEVLAINVAAVANGATRPDYVELMNTSGSPVNLAGWSLSDDGTPGEYRIPAGTSIPGNSFLIIWCDSATNTTPGLHAGFELDPDGDGVFLYDAASNRVDAVTFGAQAPDFSLGRVGNAWTVCTPTAAAPNTAATTGSASDLVLNEWMANPPPGQSDWVELYNTSATLPVPLYGIYVGTTGNVHRISVLSVLRPGGYLQLFADEGVGPDHLNFRLPAAGGALLLQNASAQQIQRVDFGVQGEGISQGRLPDGAVNIVSFPGTTSPEAPNYAASYTGPVLNEILARNVKAVTNAGRVADFVELANSSGSPASLAGMSLSVGNNSPGQWVFPASAIVPANGFLVIWCDGGRPVSTNAGSYNIGRSLDGDSGGVYLFNASGQLVNSVEYGPQVEDLSIGLSGGQFRLLSSPTPGTANAANAALGLPNAVRLNEWMAAPVSGADWLEFFNQTNLPVELSLLRLTDDLSLTGTNQFIIPPLSFIGARGFVRWIADGAPEQGRNHTSFSLDAEGEGLRLLSASGITTLDSVVFGAQSLGISEGRLPDGTGPVTRFPGSASPGEANYVLIPNLAVNEVLTHTDPPLEDAVELFNSGAALNVSGWFLSNAQDDFKKFRIPDNTIIPANGYLVLYEGQFNAGPGAFTLNSAHGDEVWLSAADSLGNLTGAKVTAKVGPALNGVSFGRVPTSVGVDYAALASRTFGQDNPGSVAQFRTGTGLPNAAPRVGPIVLNEIFYNPPPGPGEEDEYIELYNNSGADVSLFHSTAPTNTWKLEGGVEFTFPGNVTIPANGYALVVGFNPVDAGALTAFRTRQGVSPNVPVYGPFLGKLDNGGEAITLVRPDTPQAAGQPDAGFVPYVVADRVEYGDSAPWPAGAVDGGGLSLQRKAASLYGNEPLNWVGASPTPGAANGNPAVNLPVVTTQPASQTVFEGEAPALSVSANGSGPLRYQWRLNRTAIPDATNSTIAFDFALSQDTGAYDVIVSNPGGSTLSQPALLRVVVPPFILLAPTNLAVRIAQTATFGVVARGDAPLAYQWLRNGIALAGETNASFVKTNIQLADEGTYQVVIANAVGTNSVSALLLVLINPTFTLNPISQVVPVGGQVTFSAAWSGNPAPFSVEWRKSTPPVTTNLVVTSATSDIYTFTAPSVPVTNLYRLVVRNLANTTGIGSPVFSVITVPDTDHDGLPDYWEDAYGLASGNPLDRDLDSDHDGVSNWLEFIAGTDPTNPASYLRVDLSVASNAATVQFNATSNKTYRVQYTDALRTPWLTLSDILARTNSHIESIPDPTWTTNRFYRLVTPGGGQ